MISFDFITDEAFRSCLESDHSELEACLQASAWKSVHVLAGSIIEAILTDHLLFSDLEARSKFNPLKIDLATAISTCQQEGVISEKTAHLCSAIKEYRNLIHPGRSVRLGETIDENSARVAHALVGMIVGEVSKKKKETYGYTAEQLAAKLEADPSAKSILRHLLEGMHRAELERLLLKVIPRRHAELSGVEDIPKKLLTTLEECYQSAFGMAPEQAKQKVAKKLVSVIKGEAGETVLRYETAFFGAEQLKYLSDSESRLVKKHILGRAREEQTVTLLRLIRSVEEYITPEEAGRFMGVMIYFAYFAEKEELRHEAENYFRKPSAKLPSPSKVAAAKKITELIKYFREKGFDQQAQSLEQHKHAWDMAVTLDTVGEAIKQIVAPK